ncbi:MAG: hypothetical protein ABW105_00925 [Candidatus Thiodiazotropha sp. 6PLUC1]
MIHHYFSGYYGFTKGESDAALIRLDRLYGNCHPAFSDGRVVMEHSEPKKLYSDTPRKKKGS